MAAGSGMPRSMDHAPVSFAGDLPAVGLQAVGHLLLGLLDAGRSQAQGTARSHSSHSSKLNVHTVMQIIHDVLSLDAASRNGKPKLRLVRMPGDRHRPAVSCRPALTCPGFMWRPSSRSTLTTDRGITMYRRAVSYPLL